MCAKWNEVFEYGKSVQSDGLDGFKAWQPLKIKFAAKRSNFHLSPSFARLLKDVEYDSIGEDHVLASVAVGIERITDTGGASHLFVQHFRIPAMCGSELPYVKLMQIAYNAGQFSACRAHFSENILKFYNAHKLGECETFIGI